MDLYLGWRTLGALRLRLKILQARKIALHLVGITPETQLKRRTCWLISESSKNSTEDEGSNDTVQLTKRNARL